MKLIVCWIWDFRKILKKIVSSVLKQRQTLLFSATVPDEVRQICSIAMKRDHEFVRTIEEGSGERHSQVRQMHLIATLVKQFPILYSLLTDHIAEDVDYKVIVFCTTAMVTKLVSELLSELGLNEREIHSRKPQGYRTRVSKEFRESKGLILVSSDVSARGVDYPDITLVVQYRLECLRTENIYADLVGPAEKARKYRAYCCWHHGKSSSYLQSRICL